MTGFNKNLIPRRIHRERSQPQHRVSKHGLLEKKKDYKLRARDHNRKQLRLKILKEKASFRNPDEFYYGMIRSATDGGRVRKKLNLADKNAIPIAHRDRDQRLLAETQDKGYVGFKCASEMAKVEKLKGTLHFAGEEEEVKRRHVLYVDDEEEGEKVMKEMAKKVVEKPVALLKTKAENPLERKRRKAYEELRLRTERRDKLKTVLHDMEVEKNMLAKGRRILERRANPRTGAPAIYRWQQERKK